VWKGDALSGTSDVAAQALGDPAAEELDIAVVVDAGLAARREGVGEPRLTLMLIGLHKRGAYVRRTATVLLAFS
jgi:hypothetical protein